MSHPKGPLHCYDRYANLLSASVTKCSAPTLSLSVNNNNRITNTGFAYDAGGNLTADGFATFTWNAEGRMAATAGVSYTYDGDGKRVRKSNGKLYWYGLSGQVLAESDLSGNITYEYIYFGGTRIARRTPSGTLHYYLSDRLGSARVVTTATGGIVEESDFYPFGQERVITDTLDNNYKFTGHERDSESGLDHTLHRQYASNLARWHSPDPKPGHPEDPQSWNRYA
ncbi:MAG: RHS repeat-associated core domain-containing protein, partial [Nevskiales bacterium]